MKVCSCGNINEDIIFTLKSFPEHHEKINTSYYYIGHGGSAANTAWWLASMGHRPRMVGCVGSDLMGDESIRGLEESGVETSGISRSCKRTGIATIFSSGQDKRMIKVRGANEDITFKESDYSGATHIHLSSVSENLAKGILEYAKDNGIRTSWDPSESLHAKLLDKVDYLFINEDDIGRNNAALEENRPRNIIITKNGGGCNINHEIDVPSLGWQSIDTTGAGDAFDAGFIHGLENGLGHYECAKWATACASMNVRAVGSRDGFTSLDVLKKIIKEEF